MGSNAQAEKVAFKKDDNLRAKLGFKTQRARACISQGDASERLAAVRYPDRSDPKVADRTARFQNAFPRAAVDTAAMGESRGSL